MEVIGETMNRKIESLTDCRQIKIKKDKSEIYILKKIFKMINIEINRLIDKFIDVIRNSWIDKQLNGWMMKSLIDI